MRIVEVELHQILVAEVELFRDPLVCWGGCQPFVTEAASDVSDVDQMDMRFAEFELCQILVSEVELGSGLMVVVFSQILVSEVDHGLRCGCASEFGF